jgi:hypothetical protein
MCAKIPSVTRAFNLPFFKARSCDGDPPTAWLGIDVDWPLKQQILGTQITYTCPFMTKTNTEELAGSHKQLYYRDRLVT